MREWFVASSIVGYERKAANRLSSFETFLPEAKAPRHYLGEVKDYVSRALFPGYFFLRCDPELRPIRYAEYRGLVGFGGSGVGEPIAIEQVAIDELRMQVDECGVLRLADFRPGDAVEIQEQGNFWLRRGLYECKTGQDRVIVLLNAVTPFRVEVPRAALRAVSPS